MRVLTDTELDVVSAGYNRNNKPYKKPTLVKIGDTNIAVNVAIVNALNFGGVQAIVVDQWATAGGRAS